MTDLVKTEPQTRELTLLKAIGFDRLAPEQRELALAIADRYQLDPLLRHILLIDGRPYITRDGLLHVAHRSGQLDGIETTEPMVVDGFWRCTASVYRKDMSRPFTYGGRYPTSGGNQKFAPEMAVKVAEVQALRRAFDVSAPTIEERWDLETPAEEPAKTTLAEKAAEKAATLRVLERNEEEPVIEPVIVNIEEVAEGARPQYAEPTGLAMDQFLAAAKGKGIHADEYIGALSAIGIPNVAPKAVPGQIELLTDEQRLALAKHLGLIS